MTFLVVLQVLNGSCAYAAESCETDELAAVQVLRRSEDARPRKLIRKFKRAIYEWSKKKHYYYKTTTPAPLWRLLDQRAVHATGARWSRRATWSAASTVLTNMMGGHTGETMYL